MLFHMKFVVSLFSKLKFLFHVLPLIEIPVDRSVLESLLCDPASEIFVTNDSRDPDFSLSHFAILYNMSESTDAAISEKKKF